MKLRFSGTSPFVRKVVIQALETGLDSKIERVTTATTDPAAGQGEPAQQGAERDPGRRDPSL